MHRLIEDHLEEVLAESNSELENPVAAHLAECVECDRTTPHQPQKLFQVVIHFEIGFIIRKLIAKYNFPKQK